MTSRSGKLQYLAVTLCLVAGTLLTAGPVLAGGGIVAGWSSQAWTASTGTPGNQGVALLSTNTTGTFATSTGAPPGESNVFVSTGWASGSGTKYWKVHFAGTGFEDLTLSSQQKSTDDGFYGWDGPRDFKVQYSLDDSTWTDVPGGGLTLSGSWTAGGRLTDLSLPAALDDQPDVYLRWIMSSNASVGTDGFTDNAQSMIGGIYIRGQEIPVAPTDILLSSAQLGAADPPDTLVGTLSAVDGNQHDTWAYTLVSGAGDTDNGSFYIAGDELRNSLSLAPGTYSIRVNVNDGTYDFARTFVITVSAYAVITGGDTSFGDYVTHVAYAGIDHSSGDDAGYADYTAQSATVVPGGNETLTVTVMLGDPEYPASVVAWIDWNQNYSFDDDGETYVIGTDLGALGLNTASAVIDVPATAAGGSTRMRIVMNALNGETPPPNGGSGTFWGDAEDYTILVAGPTAVTLQGLAGRGSLRLVAGLGWLGLAGLAVIDVRRRR